MKLGRYYKDNGERSIAVGERCSSVATSVYIVEQLIKSWVYIVERENISDKLLNWDKFNGIE